MKRWLLSAMAITALASWQPADAQGKVLDGVHPYQVTQSIPDSTACAPQCILKFPTVPSGARLVIIDVSAQLGLSQDSFVIEGNGGAFFVQKPYPTASYLAAPVTVYFEAGSTPTARFFVQNTTQHTSLIVTFAGYLVPA